ncbi:hypothetical protein M426DRAFT_23385 [Hypoxylon sp. CI-4A]|nr:hypothetical protein M426DRAFT_23385 [Hypoxylon sp. CI-4A]
MGGAQPDLHNRDRAGKPVDDPGDGSERELRPVQPGQRLPNKLPSGERLHPRTTRRHGSDRPGGAVAVSDQLPGRSDSGRGVSDDGVSVRSGGLNAITVEQAWRCDGEEEEEDGDET